MPETSAPPLAARHHFFRGDYSPQSGNRMKDCSEVTGASSDDGAIIVIPSMSDRVSADNDSGTINTPSNAAPCGTSRKKVPRGAFCTPVCPAFARTGPVLRKAAASKG